MSRKSFTESNNLDPEKEGEGEGQRKGDSTEEVDVGIYAFDTTDLKEDEELKGEEGMQTGEGEELT